MKKNTFVYCNALVFVLLAFAATHLLASDGNPLKDAGFEQQLSPGQGGWTLFDHSRYSSDHARSGSNSLFNWGFSRTVPSPPFLQGTASGSFQEFPASPGSQWQLTGYGMVPNPLRGAVAFGIVQLSFFDDRGNDLGTVETADSNSPKAKLSNKVNANTIEGEWILMDTGVATAPPNTTKIHAFTLFVDYSGSDISQGVYFDDLKLCEVSAGDKADCR